MTDATAILVLGMHRSGTSATTRVLNLLGADLGANLLEAQADNAKGFWEHAEAVQIHEELLTALGRTWHDVREMPDGWMEQPASYAAIDKIVRLIRRDFGGSALWAVKDPRMCRLVPLWREALRRTGVRPAALMVVRRPDEVAGSLLAREGWSKAHADLMWMQHTLEAIRHTADMPRSIIGYDDLLTDWRKGVARVGTELGIAWPCLGEEVHRQIDAFLSPEDRHHRAPEEIAASVETVDSRSAVERLYALCADVAEGRTSWPALEQFDTRYVELAYLYRGVTQQKYELDEVALKRINHIRLIESELKSAGEQIAEFSALATERANHIQLLSTQLQQIIDVATERQARIDDLAQQLSTQQEQQSKAVAERQAYIDDLERVAAERASRVQSLEEELQETTARLQSVLDELHAVRTTVADMSVRYGRQIEDIEALSKRCAELDDALQQARLQGGEAAVELANLREHRDQFSRVLDLTLSRRWLLHRIWDLTVKKPALRNSGPKA